MNWISTEEILVIHARVIESTGGAAGIINPGALDSAVKRPLTSFAGNELFPSLIEKVAALAHTIIAFHPFVDGNKRTALVAADVCLRLNDMKLAPSDEVENFFWSIARGEQEVPQIAKWLKNHVSQHTSA